MRHTLVFHTTNLGRKLQKSVAFKSPQLALSYSESYALIILDYGENLTQSQLAVRLNLDPASIVSLIDELEKQGLVKREDLFFDRRKHKILLTDKGKKVVAQIKKRTFNLDSFLKDKLSRTEVENLHLALNKVDLYLNQWKGGE